MEVKGTQEKTIKIKLTKSELAEIVRNHVLLNEVIEIPEGYRVYAHSFPGTYTIDPVTGKHDPGEDFFQFDFYWSNNGNDTQKKI